MKKITTLLPAFAIAASLACSGANVNYKVTGKNAPKDGAAVQLIDRLSGSAINGTVVSKGSFELKGKAEKDAFLTVVVDGVEWSFQFFNDGKPVQLNVADSSLTGSALNTKLSDCVLKNAAAYAEYNDFIEAFTALPGEEQEARIDEFMAQYRTRIKAYADFYRGLVEENRDNLIPAARHPFVLDFKRKMDEADAMRAAEAARRREAAASSSALVGQKFRDLEEPDVNGRMHKLSEYVGRGKWVLVDFWAAWCNPCKVEMPNVVAAYKKYHSKGFEVVGLSFDRNKEDWVVAIRDWEMPWIHLSDLKYWQTAAAGVYSVTAIPDNLLISPDGTVVARGLRGAALEAMLAEIFK